MTGPSPLQTRLLILQGTPFCNLDCRYCYLPDRDRRDSMSMATLRLAARHLRDDGLAGPELTVVWHAGEPLVLPVTFYEEAFGVLAEELGATTLLSHSLQTNATRVDDAWCRLFLRHAVTVGVSVDGPAALHDAERRTRGGRGTHAAVVRGLRLLQAHGVALHAIAVVTAATLADPDGFFDWFVDHGIHELGCNFDEAEGGHRRSSLEGHDAAHAAFLQRLLERSVQCGGRLVVRELAQAWQRVAAPLPRWIDEGGRNWPDNAQVQPLALLSVAANGDFGCFSPEFLGQRAPGYGDFVLGNVHRTGYRASLQGPTFQRLWREIRRGVAACERGCAHFAYCGGGAPANKLYELGTFEGTETLYCRAMVQRPFETVLQRLEQEQLREVPCR